MAAKQKVLLVGASGETGSSILDGLELDGGFNVTIFVRPTSLTKPSVLALKQRGYTLVFGDLKGKAADLVPLLDGIDTVVSAIGPHDQLDQITLVDAAKEAGVKRFVPCGFTTICPRGGIMAIRDEKEIVHDHIFRHHLPYTIIDVGYWHQLSFPRTPSGRSDYADIIRSTDVYGDGKAPNLLIDLRDIGRFVARIIKDPRTLNKRIVAYSDELSQNQVWALVERLSGETIPRTYVSTSEIIDQARQAAAEAEGAGSSQGLKKVRMWTAQYKLCKYARRDNTLENAIYLGYVSARDLYPEIVLSSFEQFVQDLLNGKATRPYAKR